MRSATSNGIKGDNFHFVNVQYPDLAQGQSFPPSQEHVLHNATPINRRKESLSEII